MIRSIIISLLLFISSYSFGQTTTTGKNILASYDGKDATRGDNSFFSLDKKCETLVIPSDNNGFKLYGIKIFDSDGNEILSEKINPDFNPNSINVSKLSNGEYIVHLVTVEQILYRAKLVIRR